MKRTPAKGPLTRSPATGVDAYLAALPDDTRLLLEKLRKTIQAAAPKAEEGMSYGMPVYKLNGPLVYFGAFKNHCSLFAVGKSILTEFADELEPFRTAGVTIQFTLENPLPASLVRKIVKARVAQNKARLDK